MMKAILSVLLSLSSIVLLANCTKKVNEVVNQDPPNENEVIPLYIQQEGSNDVELTNLGNGEWEITTTGNDPYFFVKTAGKSIDLSQQFMLQFEYFSTTGIGRMLVFVGDILDIPYLITYPNLGRVEGYATPAIDLTATQNEPRQPLTSLRLTLGDHSGIVVRMRSVIVRSPTEQELKLAEDREQRIQNDIEHSERLRAYLNKSFASSITAVKQRGTKIIVEGEVNNFTPETKLVEVPLWKDVTALSDVENVISLSGNGRFEVEIDKVVEDGYDRLLSGWAIAKQNGEHYELASSLHYVTEQESSRNLPLMTPDDKKGIGGIDFEHPDMEELGITSITFNILLNDFIFRESGPNRISYEYGGRTWYIAQNMIDFYDRDVEIAARKNLMVSAIILIKQIIQSPGGWSELVAHPEADPSGAFVMPNFSEKESVIAYAAAMNFLADRYSSPQRRIHHYIMHNEIQNGFFWTTAGQKTDITYMDLYQKSMRMTQLLARQYDQHAKALISLDHGWTNVPDPRAYAGKTLFDYLVSFSKKEGDYEWGVAFHPYPQDIVNPRTWEDNQSVFNFNTPFITYKNLEVLDAYVKQPSVAFNGQYREVQLTEQSPNSPDYSQKSMEEQAAAMAFAWQKIEYLSSITAHQYHLQADAREEGGLKLGLRKYRDDPDDPFGKKPIWHVYKALGTPNWESAVEFAKPIIGIQDWDEVIYKGPIN